MSENSLNSSDIFVPFEPSIYSLNHINQIHFKKANSLKILYLNACSISNKIEDLQFILKSVKSTCHVIAISESWIQDNNTITLQNYSTLVCNRFNKRGGGVCLLIHDSIKNFECIENFNDNRMNMLSAKLFFEKQEIFLSVFYNPPNMSAEISEKFLSFLDNRLNQCSSNNSIIVGDFNINLLANSDLVEKYKNLINMNNFYICDSLTPTRPVSGSVLDHVIVNKLNQDISIFHTHSDISDHNLMFCEFDAVTVLKISEPDVIIKQITNYESLKSEIKNNINIDITDSVNNMCNKFMDSFKSCIKKCTISKKVILKKDSFKLKPWIDAELLDVAKTKYYWFLKLKKMKKTNNCENICLIRNEYNFWRNKYASLKRDKKKVFFSKKFESSLNDNKRTWKAINCVLHDGVDSTKPNLLIKDKNNMILDNLGTANTFNDHFVGVGNKFAEKFKNQRFVDILPTIQPERAFELSETNSTEVFAVIMNLNKTSSKGIDGISVELLKQCAVEIAPLLAVIINRSFSEGIFPDIFKSAKTIPIFKSGSKSNPNNYRPIAILSAISKIFEMIFKRRLLDFIVFNDILTKHQYGFRGQSSTNSALFDLVNNIQDNLNHSLVAAIFLDLSKAFDSVNIEILIHKLRKIGLSGNALMWIKTYLTNRAQVVNVNGVLSDTRINNIGVPQGSVLGPILFLLFINDILQINCVGDFYLYADDIALVYNSKKLNDLEVCMNSDLKKIHWWLNNNQLVLNVEKTKTMLFKSSDKLNVCYNKMPIESVSSFKYLGFILDYRLNFNEHVNKLICKLSSIAGVFRRVGKFIHHKLKRLLFFAFFHSNLIYAIPLWGNVNKSKRQAVQVIQNRAIKNLYQLEYRSHTFDIHKSNKLLPVDEIFNLKTIINTYNIVNKTTHTNSSFIQNNNVHSYNTRKVNSLHIGGALSNSLKSISCKLFNNVEDSLKLLNKSRFNSVLKKSIEKSYFDSKVKK